MNIRPSRKQMLAVGVEPFKKGEIFRKWPLHVTIVPWFIEARQRRLIDGLQEVQSATKPFKITMGSTALFGFKKNTPVRLIEESDLLQTLHLKNLAAVYNSKGQFDERNQVGYKYRPHITERENEIIPTVINVSQVALVEALTDGSRHVSEVFEFET
jgi:2'-5' RNA ligase